MMVVVSAQIFGNIGSIPLVKSIGLSGLALESIGPVPL